MITLNEYKSELDVLTENKNVCVENDKVLELQMLIVSSLVKDDNKNDNLLRLQTKVNDRYFVNQEMINVLDFAIKYLKTEKDIDAVYNNYLDRYHVLAKRFISISKDKDFKELSIKYLLNANDVNKSL